MPGKPFQSKLGAHFELIRSLRQRRRTWQQIVEHLATLGVSTDKGSLCAFFKRHARRPYALGTEPEPPAASATAATKTPSVIEPASNPGPAWKFSAVYAQEETPEKH